MRTWTGVGIAVGLVALVGAVIAAVVLTTGDGGDDSNDVFTREDAIETRAVQLGDLLLSGTVIGPEAALSAFPIPEGLPTRVQTPRPEGAEQTQSPAEVAEEDDDPSLPGRFVASQGRGHFEGGVIGHVMTPYCDGVQRSPAADALTPVAVTPVSPFVSTPAPPGMGDREGECYESNPPTSGRHLRVQRNVDIGGGIVINVPPDPDVYPHDVEIPRDAIPHILEHAGVFVGYHCAEGDTGCEAFVAEIEDLVNQLIDEFDDRVVMARDTDLPVGEIGLAAWTRVLNARWDAVELDDIEEFISVHSCRFDPEGFC